MKFVALFGALVCFVLDCALKLEYSPDSQVVYLFALCVNTLHASVDSCAIN